MLIAIVDACGYQTGEQNGKIEVYKLEDEMEEKYNSSENLLDFYENELCDVEPVEVRSNDLDGIICV